MILRGVVLFGIGMLLVFAGLLLDSKVPDWGVIRRFLRFRKYRRDMQIKAGKKSEPVRSFNIFLRIVMSRFFHPN